MICKRVKEQIPEYLSGGIEESARARLLEHLDGCAACREEVAKLDTVWHKMEILEAAEPSPALRPRFHEMLAAYQCGLAANQAVTVKKSWFTVPSLLGLLLHAPRCCCSAERQPGAMRFRLTRVTAKRTMRN